MKAWEATVRKTQAAAKKRANTIFGTSYAVENNSEESNDFHNEEIGEIYQAEQCFSNGDYYTGNWANSKPHDKGKYCWTDGCIYTGEWFKGRMMGKGTFTWPSGAMYEGNFKRGSLDGEGMYTGANGGVYKGSWEMNLNNGYGRKEYENGDVYEGQWSRGSQEGEGKYQWENGMSYIGEWKKGKMCGVGKMYWPDGKVCEGNWEDGLPEGTGTVKWADGSFYVGIWSNDPMERNGTYYPSSSNPNANLDWDSLELYNELKQYKICPTEKIPIWPSQKRLAMWRSSRASDGGGSNNGSVNGKPRRLSVDGIIDFWVDRDLGGGSRLSDGAMPSSWTAGMGTRDDGNDLSLPTSHSESVTGGTTAIRIPKIVKRQGETISKGHRNYELMLNLQLGIRHSVGRPGPPPSLDLKPSAFDPKERYWTKFPPEGSKYTPPHQSSEFKWKDYCPKVFRTLRMLFKVDPAEYMLSICGNDALRELSSPGKSGSFFYLTDDDRYMIKTMKKAEVKVLIRMLNAYYNHVREFENTLVTKYYSLHCVKLNGQKVRFVIMGNLFCSEYAIHRIYDLKGSTFGRVTDKPESKIDATTTLKDLDLNFLFRLQKTWYQEFLRQVDRDCEFLEQERIMDYSLLVGLHFTESKNDEAIPSSVATPVDNGGSVTESLRCASRADVDQWLFDPAGWASIKLGINMLARVERTVRTNDTEIQLVGEPTGECYNVIMFFGIIDILQDYDISKKLEHAYKSMQYDPNSISAVDPRMYSRRFRDYVFKVFAEAT